MTRRLSLVVLLLTALSAALGGPVPAQIEKNPIPSAWRPVDTAVGPDGRARLLWTHPDRRREVWTLNTNGSLSSVFNADFFNSDPIAIAVGGDNKTRLLSFLDDGRARVRRLNLAGTDTEQGFLYGPYTNWRVVDIAVGSDNKTRLLWSRSDGQIAIWVLDANDNLEVNATHGPFGDWRARSLSVSSDSKMRVLWAHPTGQASAWVTNVNGQRETVATYGPYTDAGGTWGANDMTVSGDGKSRLLWSRPDNAASLWVTDALLNRESVSATLFASYNGDRPSSTVPNDLNQQSYSLRPLALSLNPDGQMRLLWSGGWGEASLWSVAASGAVSARFDYNLPPSRLVAQQPYPGELLIQLTWTARPNVSQYNVYRYVPERDGYSNTFRLVAQVTQNSYVDQDVTPSYLGGSQGTTYYYRVVAVTAGIESTSSRVAETVVGGYSFGTTSSSVQTSTAPTEELAAPSNLTAVGGVGQVTLNWGASGGAASYVIERSVAGGSFTELATVPASALTYRDTNSGLVAGTLYAYRVVAVGSTGSRSAASNTASATIRASISDA